jgi:hypothetical protein
MTPRMHRDGRSRRRSPRRLQSAQQLLQGPAISVRDAVYEAFDETSACIAEERRCGDYVFTFKGAKETTIRSDDSSFHKTTTYYGRTCGRTLVGQPWKITSKSNNDHPSRARSISGRRG